MVTLNLKETKKLNLTDEKALLELYLYNGILGLTHYNSGEGFIGTFQSFCNYYNLQDEDEFEVKSTLHRLLDKGYIGVETFNPINPFYHVYAINWKEVE